MFATQLETLKAKFIIVSAAKPLLSLVCTFRQSKVRKSVTNRPLTIDRTKIWQTKVNLEPSELISVPNLHIKVVIMTGIKF